MAQITIRIKDKDKAQKLMDLLSVLDFIDFIESNDFEENKKSQSEDDFFAMAGIWADRDVTLETIRQKAWPRQST